MTDENITNLGATATEHDTRAYAADTETSGDQTTYAAQQRRGDNTTARATGTQTASSESRPDCGGR